MGTYNIKAFTTRSDFVELSYYRYDMYMNCQSQHTHKLTCGPTGIFHT